MTVKAIKKRYYVERDISWMYFNHRILQEAKKEDIPLLERLSFLGIYSNNLDEFFRVRVASLNRILESGGLKQKYAERLKDTLKTINRLNATYSREYACATDEVFRRLSEHQIRLLNETQLNEEQQQWLRDFFYERLNGSVNTIWMNKIDDISTLEDNRIYLLVRQHEVARNKSHLAIVKVPDRVYGRFITVPPSEGFSNVMYLDDIVRFCLPLIFMGGPESEYKAYSFKFTKDAEMDIENDSDYSVIEKISQGVYSRKKGDPVRLIYDREMPREMLKKIVKRLNVTELDTLLGTNRYQNHKDLMSFPDCGHTELKYEPWPRIMKEEFLDSRSVLDSIREKDRFIHVPYHSFESYVRVLQEAALRPEVVSVKTTLYRLAKDSKVVKSLISAARNGKKVTAVVELLARFDEESNIKWSRRMQEEGINVIFGVEGLKIHSKLLLIESKRGNIACIGTGNFHEGNARVYTDYLMMTARPHIVGEVAKVFKFIDRPFSQVRFRELMVSPNSMKARILRYLNAEIKNASAKREAWVKIKINHITDADIVAKLYQASRAGVRIDILIRGNCSLMPAVRGLSDNIRCVGIIDRYLEHSRILIFCNGGSPRYFLGSADWMPRNLINRIEVMTPVYDEVLQRDLLRTIDYGMRDTTNGRLVDGHGGDPIQDGSIRFHSQEQLYKAYSDESNESGSD